MHTFLVDEVAALPILLVLQNEHHQRCGCKDDALLLVALSKVDVAGTIVHSEECRTLQWGVYLC